VVLTRLQNTANLSKEQSLMLLLRDNKGEEIAAVSPWNGIQLLKSKSTANKNYKFDFKTDKETWFTLTVREPKNTVPHSFDYKMSF
jgi:hypothetical protein